LKAPRDQRFAGVVIKMIQTLQFIFRIVSALGSIAVSTDN
jgi:hypothetical protein